LAPSLFAPEDQHRNPEREEGQELINRLPAVLVIEKTMELRGCGTRARVAEDDRLSR
jgi:hypothetical protein